MHKLYSTTRDNLRSILLGDDILRLRTVMQPTNELDQYRHDFVGLLNEALRLRAWYCARYLLGVTNLDFYNTRVKAELLWSSLASSEPEMAEMAYTTDDTLEYIGVGGVSATAHLAMQASSGMAQALANNWDGTWRSLDWRSVLMHTGYSCNATIQVLLPLPRSRRGEVCERVLKQHRVSNSDDYIVQSAIEANDWMLLNYLETSEKSTLVSALKRLDGGAPVPWILHRAAANNAGHAIEVILSLIDINMVDDHGNTMLHVASRFGNITTVEKLLEAGADPRKQNLDGNTALEQSMTRASPSLRCATLIAAKLTDEERFAISRKAVYQSASESIRQMLYDPIGFETLSLR